MAKTRGGHSSSYKPHVQPSSPPPADVAPPPVGPLVDATPPSAGPPITDPTAAPVASLATSTTVVVVVQGASSPAAPAPRNYNTRVRPTPSSPPHPRPSKRASPPKRARISGPGESSSSQAQEPQSPPIQGPTSDFPLDLSPASLIRRPIFHCGPIIGNSDCSAKELHNEIFYDIYDFAALPKLKDSMRLVQRYSL